MENNTDIKVSICCIAYNQEKYIRLCLDGFVMQKTNFKYEVLIHDDASTDRTADIIKEYEEKYPDLIKPIYQTENQWSKGIPVGAKYNYPRVKGKYVAMCEGDDYWTDPYKLQKQVDFLEEHPDYSMCASNCLIEYVEINKTKKYIPFRISKGRTTYTTRDLWYINFIPTNTVMYKWDKSLVNLFEPGIFSGDWFMNIFYSTKGKIKIFPELSGVYHKHSGGISSLFAKDTIDDFYLKFGQRQIKTFYCIYKNILHSSKEYAKKMLTYELTKLIGICYKNQDIKQLKQILNDYPELVGQCIYERQARYKRWVDRLVKISIFLGVLLGISVLILSLYITKIL